MIKPIKYINNIPLYFDQIEFNITPLKRTAKNISADVVHDTGNIKFGANGLMHQKYFDAKNRNSSADFFVTDKDIWQINDPTKYYTWHCGDRPTGKYYHNVTNRNSISIEICVNKDSNIEKAVENAINLARSLNNQYDIGLSMTLRHWDITRKMCPGKVPLVDNTPVVNKNWIDFKKKLSLPIKLRATTITTIENKNLTWEEIIKKYTNRDADWIQGIEAKREMAELGYDLGALNCMANLPTLIHNIGNNPKKITGTWETIIKENSKYSDIWIEGINASYHIAKAKSNLGDIEIMKFMPNLIKKIGGK